ncbi:anhydro-N-acetylmuramic acid kinase (plasmid) [Pedobacter sp. BS3]|uniref:anhydro-N-acetylmuramic acid kinase n=1 Tax=Pedobacter sp. BS3 TaxID=2567937 RepID=UPI0011F02CD4|nr:anhydro-N-acetylmuramic acid kinase [Pedobacter sp. BS3]TZF86139.1 anhydro-N-acetylmuramic acid kinase [Pedobacter sp. BS3]
MSLRDIGSLWQMAQKPSRLIIGLMSGTSLDGLDMALCRISGHGKETTARVLEFETAPYENAFKDDILRIFSKKTVDLEKLTLLNEQTGNLHAGLINAFLKKHALSPSEVDCIASHGQTIYHAPKRLHGLAAYPDATLQIGDADHIAVKTGIITLSDFRQKHLAVGGEGAPLAVYGDYLLFSDRQEDRILLNIGGIANFTYLPSDGDTAKIVCTDTGPGNTLLDALARRDFSRPYDRDAEIGFRGNVNETLLTRLLEHPFFKEALPKTTGPELFNLDWLGSFLKEPVSGEDLMATLAQLSARSIAEAIISIHKPAAIYVSGGGCHNPLLMRNLQQLLPPYTIKNFDELGINPDAKEALLFAVLANEAIAGKGTAIAGLPAVTMGKISMPG